MIRGQKDVYGAFSHFPFIFINNQDNSRRQPA